MIPRFIPDIGFKELLRIFLPARKNAVQEFESIFAKKMKQKYALAFPYGRTGLLFLLKALGLKNKEIVCPAYTCVVVPHAVVFSGNTPVFVDSCIEDYNMDFDLVEKAISPQTGAIIATSIFGNPINLDRVNEIQRKHPHIYIIQDCAHSFGAEWKGERVNTVGIAAIYGLNISKIMTSIFGGMVTTDSPDVYEKLLALRDKNLQSVGVKKSFKRRLYLLATFIAFNRYIYSFVNFLERKKVLQRFVAYFDEAKIDMPSDYLERMSDFEAGVGVIQTNRYDSIIEKRKSIGRHFDELFKRPVVDGKTYSHYPLLVLHRDKIIQIALSKGIQLGTIIDYSCTTMSVYVDSKYFSNVNNAEFFSWHIINFPITDLKMKRLKQYISFVNTFRITEMPNGKV